MAFRFVVLCGLLAAANAGFLGAPAAVAYSAAPAVSSVSYASPLVSYGAPLGHAPAITSQQSNILRSYGNLGQVSTYSKTIDTPYSSVTKSDVRVSNPGYRAVAPAYGYAAPAIAHAPAISYAAPAIAHAAPAYGYAAPAYGYAAPAIAHGPAALGVAYSAAPAVAHMTYSGSYGLNYAW